MKVHYNVIFSKVFLSEILYLLSNSVAQWTVSGPSGQHGVNALVPVVMLIRPEHEPVTLMLLNLKDMIVVERQTKQGRVPVYVHVQVNER